MMRVASMVALLDAILMVLLPCSAFTADRSVNVPTGWNVVPLLETEQKVTIDHSPNGNTQVTTFDKVSQATDTKKATQPAERNISQDTEHDKRDFVPEVVEDVIRFTKTVKDAAINSAKQTTVAGSTVSSPRNVILLLVEESDQDQKDLWKDFRMSHSFPVEGHLQSCHNAKVEATRFFLDKALIGGSMDTECDCERYLRSNVATLLLWARDVRGMTTGTLLNTNFTIPSLFRYEEPVSVPVEFDEMDENMKLNIRKAKSETHSDWIAIDLGKPAIRVPAAPFSPNNREDGSEDPAWNVFNMFSRIRTALFRSLLESLGRNVASTEESNPYGRSHPLWSNLADIVNELKSIQNQNGFILVAATPASELNSALAILQPEMSQDMLMVVAGLCSDDAKLIPFFANGPAARSLHEATSIWDLPRVIRTIIAGGCQGAGCRVRRQDNNLPPVSQPLTASLKENVSKNATDVTEKVMNDSKTEIPNAATNAAGNTEGDQIKEVLPVKKLETMGDQIKEVLPVKKLETMGDQIKEVLPVKKLETMGDQIKEVLPVKKLETMGDQIKEVLPVKKLETMGDQIKEVLPVKKLETMGDQIKEVLPVKKLETMEEENNENKESLPDAQNRNSANSNMKTTEFCIILGAITSVFVSFALAS